MAADGRGAIVATKKRHGRKGRRPYNKMPKSAKGNQVLKGGTRWLLGWSNLQESRLR